MNEITAVVITKNEEKTISDCLKSLSFVKRIIVVDSDSTDKTKQLALKLNAEVINHTFTNFKKTREFALTKVNTPWVLYIDADERITPKLKESILKAICDTSFSAYSYKRKNYYLGKEWPYKETVTKLFLKDRLEGWVGTLHEGPDFEGPVKTIDGELLHYTHRNLEEMLNKTIEWSQIEAVLRYKNKHPRVSWWRLIRVFCTGFINSYIKQSGYKAGTVGLIESLYQGFSMFITYTRLWEMQKNQK